MNLPNTSMPNKLIYNVIHALNERMNILKANNRGNGYEQASYNI